MSTPIHVNLTPEYPRRERVALMADGDGRNPRVVRFACVNENCSHADCAGGNDVAIPDGKLSHFEQGMVAALTARITGETR